MTFNSNEHTLNSENNFVKVSGPDLLVSTNRSPQLSSNNISKSRNELDDRKTTENFNSAILKPEKTYYGHHKAPFVVKIKMFYMNDH